MGNSKWLTHHGNSQRLWANVWAPHQTAHLVQAHCSGRCFGCSSGTLCDSNPNKTFNLTKNTCIFPFRPEIRLNAVSLNLDCDRFGCVCVHDTRSSLCTNSTVEFLQTEIENKHRLRQLSNNCNYCRKRRECVNEVFIRSKRNDRTKKQYLVKINTHLISK